MFLDLQAIYNQYCSKLNKNTLEMPGIFIHLLDSLRYMRHTFVNIQLVALRLFNIW
jgi:hypothetical protein